MDGQTHPQMKCERETARKAEKLQATRERPGPRYPNPTQSHHTALWK